VCCPLPPVCQPKPRMKHLAGKHIPCPVAAMGWSGADAGGRGEAAESSRTRSAFPRFLPASGAERGPAFPLPPRWLYPCLLRASGSEEAYPEGRSRSWDLAAGRSSLGEFNHSLREDGGLLPSGAARTPKRHFTSLRKFSSDSRAS